MEPRRILPLFTVDELKRACKERGIKGFSKLAKPALVEFVITQQSEDELRSLVDTAGRKKLAEVIDNATKLLSGAQVGAERLASISIRDGEISVTCAGFRWDTAFSSTIEGIVLADHQFSCDCGAGQEGGLCLHYWAAVLSCIASGVIDPARLAGIDQQVVTMLVTAAATLDPKHVERFTSKDLSDEPIDDILAFMTSGQRFATARRELGLDAGSGGEGGSGTPGRKPRATKPSKPPKAVERVTVAWTTLEPGPPAYLDARFIKDDGSGPRESSMVVVIDEKARLLVHENCPDFDIRMKNSKQLCKHLVAVFLSMDGSLARRLLQDLHLFGWSSVGQPRRGPAAVSKSIMDAAQDVSIVDGESIKDALLVWLLDRDGARMEEIIETFGPEAGGIVGVMVGEGIIEITGDTYRPR